jgi:hypothetical protein
MIIVAHNDPNFVVVDSFVVNTSQGPVTLFEGEPISLLIDGNDDVLVGNDNSPGTVCLRITHKTALSDILSRVKPASFDTVIEEDGEISLVATFKEVAALDCMPTLENVASSVVDVHSIRPYKGMHT